MLEEILALWVERMMFSADKLNKTRVPWVNAVSTDQNKIMIQNISQDLRFGILFHT